MRKVEFSTSVTFRAVLVCSSLLAALCAGASAQTTRMSNYICTERAAKVYVTDVFQAPQKFYADGRPANDLQTMIYINWMGYMMSQHKVSGTGQCQHVSAEETYASFAAKLQQANREAAHLPGVPNPPLEIVRIDWKYMPDEKGNNRAPGFTPQGVPSGGGPPGQPANFVSGTPVKMYMYCYTQMSGGVDTYFGDIFPAELPSTATHTGPAPDPRDVDRISHAFESYLTRRGYKHNPGTSDCDFRIDEAAAEALKHQRAYASNPCRNCGRVVETHWKYGSEPAAVESEKATTDSSLAAGRPPASHPASVNQPQPTGKHAPEAPPVLNSKSSKAYGVCMVDLDTHVGYYNAPFEAPTVDTNAWVKGYKEFLKNKYAYSGGPRCFSYKSLVEAQTALQHSVAMRRNANRQFTNYVNTNWAPN